MKKRLNPALVALLLLASAPTHPHASRAASTRAGAQAAAQSKGGRPAQPRGAEKAAANEAEREAAGRRAQAVAVLRGVVEGAGEIKGVAQRARIVAGALALLWKHDEPFARANFLKAADHGLGVFAGEDADEQQRHDARAAVNLIVGALARHDPRAAESLMGRYAKLAEELTARGVKDAALSLRERLSPAEASLEHSPAQSAALAAKVLEAGVPGSLPAYLYALERRDAKLAESLFRAALSRLGGAGAYTPTQATLLSAYAFRERMALYPLIPPGHSTGPRVSFGVYSSPLERPSRSQNFALAREFLAAAGLYLGARAAAFEQSPEPDAAQVGYGYFLVKKLRGYADKFGLNRDHAWQALEAKYELLAERARIEPAQLGNLSALAGRVVEDDVFRSDGGAADLEAAEKARDPTQKIELLVAAVLGLTDAQRFAEAEQRIADVPDERVRERLADFIHFRAATAALRTGDWDAAAARTSRVGDEHVRAYLLLEAARAALKDRRKAAALDHVRAALAALTKIEDAGARARLLVAAAGLLYEADRVWAAEVLAEAVKAVNRADDYDGSGYFVVFDLPNLNFWLPPDGADLGRCFERAAQADWPEALSAAQRINSKELQAAALVAACRAALGK